MSEKNCDNCPHPGACCKHLYLSSDGVELVVWEETAEEEVKQHMSNLNLPFIPILPVPESRRFLDEITGQYYVNPAFRCPKLGPDGRCTDYENRPQLCRDYQPLDDGLCCHHPDWDASTVMPVASPSL